MPRKPKAVLKPIPFNKTESIGERIARIRKERALTQVELAEKIGIEQVLVSDYERGKLRLYDEMVIRFAIALSISTDQLLGMEDQPSKNPTVSLRFLRRIAIIETFPEAKKKAILSNLDDAIKANT